MLEIQVFYYSRYFDLSNIFATYPGGITISFDSLCHLLEIYKQGSRQDDAGLPEQRYNECVLEGPGRRGVARKEKV